MSQQVGRPKAETENVGVERKTAKDLGQPVERIKVQPEGESTMRKEAEGVSQKIQRVAYNVKERVMGSEHKTDEDSAMNKMSAKVDEVKQKMMPNDENKAMMNKEDSKMMKQNDEMDWTERYKSTDANIRK